MKHHDHPARANLLGLVFFVTCLASSLLISSLPAQASEVESPAARLDYAPAAYTQAPAANVEAPSANVEAPAANVEAPAANVAAPAAPAREHSALAREPIVLKPLEPMPEHKLTTRNVVDALASRHYVHKRLNDELSSRVFDAYLEDLDPSRSYLLQSDVNEFNIHRHNLDNALRFGNLKPAFDIFNRYQQRVIERFQKVLDTLNGGIEQFDFSRDELLSLNRKETPWAKSTAELDDLWRRRLKDSILSLKLADKEPADIQKLLIKRYTNRLTRTRQTNSEDVYQLYMNAFTKIYDPHTQYFSPRTTENFNINMSLSLEGIGAVLRMEDEFTMVERLVTAGPAEKAGQLKPNDKIIGVGQGETGEIVDVVGWRLDEVVSLIRGKKGTTVRLDIIPAASDSKQAKVIKIVRNKVKLEDQSAKSEVMEIEQLGHTYRIGVVDIPAFYVDFQAMQNRDPNFKSTTRDVAKLILDLMKQNVDGLVIDLRSNGGGALQEARELTGLFIDQGPTVQVRKKSNSVDILDDRNPGVLYDGPLAVLVNRLSASASEIFAGAIQDYQRGLVIGTRTFGKGTVQALLPLNRGQLKLTQAKFYRISGDSTQHKGIIPDILYPPRFDPDSIGESTLEHPIAWDQIDAAKHNLTHTLHDLLPELQAMHAHRAADNPEFKYLKDAFAYRQERNEVKTITLNEAERIAEKDNAEAFWVALENRKRQAQGKDPIESLDDLNDTEIDNEKEAEVNPSAGAAIVPLAENQAAGEEGPAGVDNPGGEIPAGEMPETSAGNSPAAASTATVTGSEMAVTSTNPANSPGASINQPNNADTSASSTKQKDEETLDPWLIESGQVLIDLLNLKSLTASANQLRAEG